MIEFTERTDRQAGIELIEYLRILRDVGDNFNPLDYDRAGEVLRYLTNGSRNRIASIRALSDKSLIKQETLYQISCLEDRFNPISPDGQFGIKKVRAILTWAESLGRIRRPTFVQEMVEELGLDPQTFFVMTEVPEDTIEDQVKRTKDAYINCGYKFEKKDLRRYRKDHAFQTRYGQEEIERTFHEAKDRLVPIMRDSLGVSYIPEFKTEFVQEDKYFKVWSSADSNGHWMKINTHKRHDGKWDPGQVGRLVVHEYEHAFEGEELGRRVASGELNPIHAVTIIPGPYQWRSESFADSITRFFPEIYNEMTVFEKAAVEYEILKQEVLRNAHIRVNFKREPRTRIRSYIQTYLLADSHRDVKRYLDERMENLQYRAYFLAYGGVKEMCSFAEMLKSQNPLNDRRSEFARSFLKRQMAPIEVLNEFRRLENTIPVQYRAPFSQRVVAVSDTVYENFRSFLIGKPRWEQIYPISNSF